jgi:hypothetical protein
MASKGGPPRGSGGCCHQCGGPCQGRGLRGEYDIIADASGTVEPCEIILGTKKKTLRIEIDPVIASVVVKGYAKED